MASIIATETGAPGYVQVLACDATPGSTSNLNADRANQTIAGLAFIKFDAAGTACLYNQSATHLVVDVQGYMTTTAFDDTTDARILDTRTTACSGIFLPTTVGLVDVPINGAATRPNVPLERYSGPFGDGNVVLDSGCTAYYVNEQYLASELMVVTFNQAGLRSTRAVSIPSFLAAVGRPSLAGISADHRSVFVHEFEDRQRPRVFGEAIWRIPIDGSEPTRFFLSPVNAGSVALKVSADERYVYEYVGLSPVVTEYDLVLGTSRTIPAPGLAFGVSLSVSLSSDGSMLCLGQSSVTIIATGSVVSLPERCLGFDRSNRVVVAKQTSSFQTTVSTIDPLHPGAGLTTVSSVSTTGWSGLVAVG